jgi:hypothetical protein
MPDPRRDALRMSGPDRFGELRLDVIEEDPLYLRQIQS